MWNSAKDPQEEKYQQKIEAILEEKHKAILDRSHQLVTTIFAVVGAYALILSALIIQSSSSSIGYNNTSLSQANSYIHYLNTLNNVLPWGSYFFLFLSFAFIIMSFVLQLQSFNMSDKDFKNKFIKKEGSIQVKLTQRNFIHFNIDNRDFSVHLKDGEELLDRNKQLFVMIEFLLTNNDDSIGFIFNSLIFFIVFITSIQHYIFTIVGFGAVLILLNKFIKDYQKSRKKEP